MIFVFKLQVSGIVVSVEQPSNADETLPVIFSNVKVLGISINEEQFLNIPEAEFTIFSGSLNVSPNCS